MLPQGQGHLLPGALPLRRGRDVQGQGPGCSEGGRLAAPVYQPNGAPGVSPRVRPPQGLPLGHCSVLAPRGTLSPPALLYFLGAPAQPPALSCHSTRAHAERAVPGPARGHWGRKGCGVWPWRGDTLRSLEANAAHLGSPTAAQKVSRRMRFTEQDQVNWNQRISGQLGAIDAAWPRHSASEWKNLMK